ncbi:hypothetical protein IID21_00535 [Patescibacteria group bacterium]|nr:hypothetical protein [Patescibacteria group bacterium]
MKNVFNLHDYEQIKRFEEECFIGPLAIWTKKAKDTKLEKIYVDWAIFYKTYGEGKMRSSQKVSKAVGR